MAPDSDDPEEPVPFEFTDELDLHAFSPRDAKDLVGEYLDHAWEQGWPEVRIVHGKGTGTLARLVHAVLERHPAVARHALGGSGHGSWGATVVWLRPRS